MFDRPRAVWEAPGYTIGEHTNSGPVKWSRVENIVVHYTADRRAMSDTAQYLRNMQKAYVDRRGYSLGYSVAVDQQGVSWEIRGTDYIPAANVGYNDATWVILALVDWQDECNPKMVETIRGLVTWARQQTGGNTPVIGHRDLAATRCPGSGIYGQIAAGVFEPSAHEDYDMKITDPPQRIYDSRKQHGPFDGGETRKISTGQRGAVFVNVTVVDPTGWGYATAWGAGPMPDVSIVNYDRQTISNSAWVPVAADGTIQIYTYAGCHLLVDLQATAS